MTGGGVGGLLASSDQIVQAVSLAITLIGLIWGIIDKIKGKTPHEVGQKRGWHKYNADEHH
jgi:hypothetical protein